MGKDKTIDREQLCAVVGVYHKSNYLKSFGYQKLKLTDAIMRNNVRLPPQEAPNNDDEFYYDDK